jgi:hypothetical protein
MKIRKFNENSDYISSLEEPEDLFLDIIDEFDVDVDCFFRIFEPDIDIITPIVRTNGYNEYILGKNGSDDVKYGYAYSFFFDKPESDIKKNYLFKVYDSIRRKEDLISNYDIHIEEKRAGDYSVEVFLISKDTINIKEFKNLFKILKKYFGNMVTRILFDDKETLGTISINTGTSADEIYEEISESDKDIYSLFDISKTGSIIRFKLRK